MIPLDDLAPAAVLARAGELVGQRRAAQVEDLRVCLAWADLHGEEPAVRVPGGDRLVRLDGEGTPLVRDLVLEELAIARRVHIANPTPSAPTRSNSSAPTTHPRRPPRHDLVVLDFAAAYDALNPGEDDYRFYAGLADQLSARRVVDLGCGTRVLAVLLAQRDREVLAIDPDRAMLEVARRRPGHEQVRWQEGKAGTCRPPGQIWSQCPATWHRCSSATRSGTRPCGRSTAASLPTAPWRSRCATPPRRAGSTGPVRRPCA